MVSNRLFLFPSRNRGSFDFKEDIPIERWTGQQSFQSRNRGSFDFKVHSGRSTASCPTFQSRNRDSFDFKLRKQA